MANELVEGMEEENAVKYRVTRVGNITGKIVGGKRRNTRPFNVDGVDKSVTNWKLKLEGGAVHDYVSVFSDDAAAFEAQVKAGEDVSITERYKDKVTIDDQGHERRDPLPNAELSYDAPMGDAAQMFE